MANTYTSLHYHIVFSTKNREPWLTPGNDERIWKYLGGIVLVSFGGKNEVRQIATIHEYAVRLILGVAMEHLADDRIHY